jgi:hypothetical protein
MQGYLVYVFPEGGTKGFGTAVVANHAKFDVTFFPARRNNQRVRDSFATLPARLNEKGVTDDLADIADVVELDTHNDTDDDPCEVELVADAAASNNASEILVQQQTCVCLFIERTSPLASTKPSTRKPARLAII